MKLNKSATLTRVTTVSTMERERGMAVAIGKRLTACRNICHFYTALVQSQAILYESDNFYFPTIWRPAAAWWSSMGLLPQSSSHPCEKTFCTSCILSKRLCPTLVFQQ